MLIFITYPKRFDKEIPKNCDLIYIFNSKQLFEKLSKNFKCVNIGINGNIKDENFFPKSNLTENQEKLIFDINKGNYASMKRKFHFLQNTTGNYKDMIYRNNMYAMFEIADKNIHIANKFVERLVLSQLLDIIDFKFGHISNRDLTLYSTAYNYINSFYCSYIYSLGFEKKGCENFINFFKYQLISNLVMNYKFENRNIYKNNQFHYLYVRVIIRLFIEQIHRIDIKTQINTHITYWKEHNWW